MYTKKLHNYVMHGVVLCHMYKGEMCSISYEGGALVIKWN